MIGHKRVANVGKIVEAERLDLAPGAFGRAGSCDTVSR